MRLPSVLVLLVTAFLFTGCATYDAQLTPGQSLEHVRHFFVLTNPNDSHGIAHQIVRALREQGREAETGPMTMMPEETQVVVTYEDHWSWDFGDHLVYAQVSTHDRRTHNPTSTARFSTRVPTRRGMPDIVNQLVGQLLTGKKR